MNFYIIGTPVCVFAFDEKKSLVKSVFFEGSKEEKAEAFKDCQGDKLSKYEADIAEFLKSKDQNAEIIFEVRKQEFKSEFPNKGGDALRENLEKVIIGSGKFRSMKEYYDETLNVVLVLTKEKIKGSVTDDKLIIQAVNAIDDITNSANILSVRLREWYGFVNPELSERISSHETFISAIVDSSYNKGEKETKMGAVLKDEDLRKIEEFAYVLKYLYDEKRNLEKYVEAKVSQFLPNTSAIIGTALASRLLAIGGGLEKLSKFPSSTIQVIGAEKALFRHLRGVGTSPKHGLIFQSPIVNQARRDVRGKVARLLASKLSIAIKIDYFKGKFIGDKLKKDIDEKIKTILLMPKKAKKQESRAEWKEKRDFSNPRREN